MSEKILNSFDTWINAQGVKSKGRNRTIDNISLEGIARLRELILDLAIRGMLVPQDPNDEPAMELVKEIEAEKEILIKEGKLKRQKSLPKIKDEEKLYKLPKGWVWTKLGTIGETNIGLTYSPRDIFETGTPVLRSSNIQNGQIEFNDLVRVQSNIENKNFVETGDLLICARNGSKRLVGKCAIIPVLKEEVAFGAFMAIFKCKLNFYIKIFLESPYYRNQLKGISTTTINQITQTSIKNTIIPLPPLEEQKRIVAKVDELMAFCDKLEKQETEHLKTHQLLVKTLLRTLTNAQNANELAHAWSQLETHFDDIFTTEDSIDQLKRTILQLAIMGKLIPQDPKDEPASELLKKIAVEKEKLIKEGSIKKQKPLPEISEEEKPFEVPEGWEWVRLGDITNKIGSGSTPKGGKEVYVDEGVLFLRSQNIYNHGLELGDATFISAGTHDKMSNTKVVPNDVLLNITGGSLGRTTIFPDTLEEANVSQHVTIIRPTLSETKFYLHQWLLSPYGQNLIWGRQVGANREGLSKKVLELFEVPFSPLNEQNRIIEKVNELFGICDSLKDKIIRGQSITNDMARSVLDFVD